MSEKKSFRVVVVGGGIAGLALANSLQHAGVDYVLIEKRDRLDPHTGASIGILPAGARILDQIGCYEDLLEVTASMKTSGTHKADGSLIGGISDTLQLMHIRTGYAVIFLDRQILLRIMADHIQDYSKIMLGKSVQSIEQSPDKVVVQCTDGSTVEGDIVVAADGTYSFARQEMWRHAYLAGQGRLFENDKRAMSAEYMCLFGISKDLPGMETGQTDRTYAKDMSTLSYVGKEGRVFWFVFAKMDQVYRMPNIPRYTEKDAAALVGRIGDLAIRPRAEVTVRDLYDSRLTCQLVAIEEATYQQWSHGRIVCLGDSAHKMTANLGAGASSAIESAAALSNVLVPLASQHVRMPVLSIEAAFKQYQSTRSLRVGRAMAFSNALTRVQALKGAREYFYTHYIAPRSEDSAVEMFSSFVIGAEKVDHLPIPERSLQATMPFNRRHGWGYEESKRHRATRALPLLVLTLLAGGYTYLAPGGMAFDGTLKPLYSDVLGFLATAVTANDMVYAVVLLEAIRSINRGTVLQFSTLLAIAASYISYPIFAPLYLLTLYIYSPIENFRASDNRLTDMSYTVTILPLLLFFKVAPTLLSQTASNPDLVSFVRDYQTHLLGLSQILLAYTLVPRTQPYDRLWAVKRDVPWIKGTVGFLIGAVALSRFSSIVTISWPQLVAKCGLAASVSIWLILVLRDFREAGMSNVSWSTAVLTCVAISATLGPGVLLGAGWLWREDNLINKRHKDAVVRSTASEEKQ